MNEGRSNPGAVTLQDIMIQDVLTVQADWSLDQLAQFLVQNYISGAPVVTEQGDLIGVVSLTDIVRHDSIHADDLRLAGAYEYYLRGGESRYLQEQIASLQIINESPFTVRDIMTPMVFKVSEDTTLKEVADVMIRGHIHRVFVTRGKMLVGVVTALDMLTVIRDM